MRRAALVSLLLTLAAPAAARAEPHLEGLSALPEAGRVHVTLALADAFGDEMRERIQSGLPTGIEYRLELCRDRKHWWDRPLRAATLQVVAMYNALTREYLVNFKLDGRLIESREVYDLAQLELVMTRVEALPVFALADVGEPDGTRLLVRARAELGARTLLSLIPSTLTTAWVESRKFRLHSTEPP
jgi:Domain of unknown function (DUF4390)